jgi:hypothetical protein
MFTHSQVRSALVCAWVCAGVRPPGCAARAEWTSTCSKMGELSGACTAMAPSTCEYSLPGCVEQASPTVSASHAAPSDGACGPPHGPRRIAGRSACAHRVSPTRSRLAQAQSAAVPFAAPRSPWHARPAPLASQPSGLAVGHCKLARRGVECGQAGGLRVRVARQCGRSPDRRGDVALGWIEQHELAEHRRAQPVRLLP